MAKQQTNGTDVIGVAFGVAATAAMVGVAANQIAQARMNWHAGTTMKAAAIAAQGEILEAQKKLKDSVKA